MAEERAPSPFSELGEERLRRIVSELVERMTSDVMIGFHFRNVDLDRLREQEYQHAAELLGADVHYQGRPLRAAHAPHKIAGGHFSRRKELLRQILVRHAAPARVTTAWLDATEALRAQIVGEHGECH